MMQRFSFSLAGFVTLVCLASTQACTSTMDDCSNTSTCAAGGGAAKAGSSGSVNGGKSGSSSAGTSGSGEGGESGGSGGSSAMTGGDAGAGGVVALPCDGACAAPRAICDEPNDTCVECLEEADCAAGAKKKCDTAANACVSCLESSDCSTPTAAKCDGGACVKCTSKDDCTHVAGKGICDNGTCVQCTVEDEAACAGKSCNPAAKSCTDTVIGSVGTCTACLADSECSGGGTADPTARCVSEASHQDLFASVYRDLLVDKPVRSCLRRLLRDRSRQLYMRSSPRHGR
jgi:hypothetical protein